MSATKSLKKLSQKEYLKKYLSGDKKKKDKKHKSKSAGKVKIIDDDSNLIPDLDIDEELLLTGEDAPQIVGTYIEEKNNNDGKKWRSIVIKDEPNEVDEEVKCKIKLEEDLWGPKPMDRRYRDEFSPSRRGETTQNDVKNTLNVQRRRSRSNERKKKHHNYSPEKKQKKPQKTKSPDRNKNNDTVTYDSSKYKNRHSTTARERSSSDQSPPRRRRQKSLEGGGDSLEDQSTPRRRKRNSPADTNAHRRRARDSPRDQSPRRRKQKDNGNEPSPQRKVRRTSSDQSPPRRRVRDKSEDHSRRRRRSRSQSAEKTLDCHRKRRSDSEQSPSRRRGSRLPQTLRRNSFKSPLQFKRENSSPDLSPTRNRNGHRKKESDRKFKQEQLSPSQESTKDDRKISERQTSRWEQRKTSRSTSPPRTHKPKPIMTTMEGKRAGLQDAKSLQQENLEFRRREDEIFARMTGEHSGRDAEVQVRGYGRRGRRAREAQELDPEEELRKEAHEKKKKEIYDRWGKGLKQIEAHRAKIDEDMYEGSKPLARHSNDADLEKHLREQERNDDPMLEYMRKKRKDQQKHTNVPTMPTYQGSYPENRFDLRPGYRWDGVDRSNGYEKKWFDKQNEQRAVRDEAYLYSVEDM